MTNNFADAECRSDWIANRPDTEMPALADVADWPTRPNPNTRSCIVAWVSHDYDGWLACDYCQGRKPVCHWRNDRCRHGAFIDDPTTQWDPVARRHYCAAFDTSSETGSA